MPSAVHFPNPPELIERGILRENLVRNAAQKRFVCERSGLEVGGEDNQHIERNLEFSSGVQIQIIDPRLERHNPSIEQVACGHSLPSEVVDDEHAAVGFEVHWRFIELRQLAIPQIEHLQRQLSADRDDRPADSDPPSIDRVIRADDGMLVVVCRETRA